MKILEYNEVDPVQVLHLTMLALDFPFTPEQAAHIRHTDPRLYPCFTVNAVENDKVLGQVGVFHLPMISINGREEVGGIWAVSTHPAHSGQGIASVLLEEAHKRMRDSGLRFSTLGTDRHRTAYNLYQKFGYEDVKVNAIALANWENAHQPTRLCAQPVGEKGYEYVEKVFADIAIDYLGFSWRYTPFSRLRRVDINNIWIIKEYGYVVGYALIQPDQSILKITNLVLKPDIDASESIASITSEVKSVYVQVHVNRPSDISSLRMAGYHVAHPSWDAFMIKPLVPEVTIDDARRLFGIGTDRFMISWLDVT